MLFCKQHRSSFEQFGGVGDVPVSVFRSQVAEIHRQMGQEFLDVFLLPMPKRESTNCKRVPEGMERWPPLTGNGSDAGMFQQAAKRHKLGKVTEMFSEAICEQRLCIWLVQRFGSQVQVVLQPLSGRWVKNDVARLAELALTNHQVRRG